MPSLPASASPAAWPGSNGGRAAAWTEHGIDGARAAGDYLFARAFAVLGSKVRDAQLELVPYMFVVGPRDAEQGTVSVRDRIDGDLGAMPLAGAIDKLRTEVASKQVRRVASRPGSRPKRGNFTTQ